MTKALVNLLFATSCTVAAPLVFGQASPSERTDAPAAPGSKDPATKSGARQGARDASNDPVMKCRGLSGADFLTCLDRAGYGPRANSGSKQQVREDARRAERDPMQKCSDMT